MICGVFLLFTLTRIFPPRSSNVPVTVVVGGQYGSEGKGKVAYIEAQREHATIAIRVGGSNSGHTVYDADGRRHIFRHLPAAALLPDVLCVLGPGCLIDPVILRGELERAALPAQRLCIDPMAFVITEAHKRRETTSGLREQIGSTMSGTGAALIDRIQRRSDVNLASCHPFLSGFVGDPVRGLLRKALRGNERVVLEGTQGFGLSNLQSPDYPFVTSRDTTAAAFISEAALSPMDVDQIVLVIRTYPIRVGGNSGPLPRETSWAKVGQLTGQTQLVEYTTVTGRRRRVAEFDGEIVRAAIAANAPTSIVLNHVDYVGRKTDQFVKRVEASIGQAVDWLGTSPSQLIARTALPETDIGPSFARDAQPTIPATSRELRHVE